MILHLQAHHGPHLHAAVHFVRFTPLYLCWTIPFFGQSVPGTRASSTHSLTPAVVLARDRRPDARPRARHDILHTFDFTPRMLSARACCHTWRTTD